MLKMFVVLVKDVCSACQTEVFRLDARRGLGLKGRLWGWWERESLAWTLS